MFRLRMAVMGFVGVGLLAAVQVGGCSGPNGVPAVPSGEAEATSELSQAAPSCGNNIWEPTNQEDCDLGPIDFVKFAEACGAEGYRATKADEIVPALQAALQSNKVALVEAVVDPRNQTDRVVKLLDQEIGALEPGRFRTQAEFSSLLTDSGFELLEVHPTAVLDMQIIEARPLAGSVQRSLDRPNELSKVGPA